MKLICIIMMVVTIISVLPTYQMTAECFVLQAFKEHLDLNYLRHGIIIQTTLQQQTLVASKNDNISYGRQLVKEQLLFASLLNQYYLQVFNFNSTKLDFKQLFNYFSPRIGILLHVVRPFENSKAIKEVLVTASVYEKFNYSCSWLIIIEEQTDNSPLAIIHSLFGHLNVMINADITVGIVKSNNTMNLYDIYNICPKCGSYLNVIYKGVWSLNKGFHFLADYRDSFVSRRKNLQNISLNVATALLEKSPYISTMDYLESFKDMQNDTMQRKTYQLMTMLQPLYNFTFSLQICDTWGAYINNTWTGTMALLEQRKIEFTLCPMRYKTERFLVSTYSPHLHSEKIHFLLRHPKRASIRNIFFEPLNDTVWWCILALIVITTLLLVIHVHSEYRLYCELSTQYNARHVTERHLDFILLTILEAIFMQGPAPEIFRNNSTRLLLVSVSLFSVLLMQFYGAFIVSSLLSEPPRTINNLAALYNSSLKIGMENISYNYEIFNSASNQLVSTIYKQRICNQKPSNIMTLEEGVEHIAKGKFAFHVSIDRAYRLLKSTLTQTEFCELQEIAFNTPFVAALSMAKSSPYNKFISTAVLKFRESSLLQYNDRRWEIHKLDCSAIRDNEVEVDLVHFAPLLVFLVISTIIAISIFIAEYIYRKQETRIKNECGIIGHTVQQCLAHKQKKPRDLK